MQFFQNYATFSTLTFYPLLSTPQPNVGTHKRCSSLNLVISVISAVLSKTTLTILDSTGGPVFMEPEIVRVVSLNAKEISDITQLTLP